MRMGTKCGSSRTSQATPRHNGLPANLSGCIGGEPNKLVDALKGRKIPFVIKNLSILSHRLVRDLIAYLRLIDQLSDDVACARVLAMPAWGLEPADLVRLIERAAKGKGISLWDTMQAAKSEPAFSGGGRN